MKAPFLSGDVSVLRRINTRATLHALRSGGPRTLTQLARATELSRQTVEVVLDELMDQVLVEVLAPAAGGMGRPARRFRFHAGAGYVAGVDIGAHKVLVMLSDLSGEIVAERRAPVPADLSAPERLAVAERTAVKCADEAGVPRSKVWAAAVGTSGVVDPSGRVRHAVAIPGWPGLDLAGHAGRWFGGTGLAGNDASLAAVAEHWRGSARHVDDLVYVLAGHRMGAGLLIGGRPHTGRTGAAAEIGMLSLIGWAQAPAELFADVPADEVFAAARDGDATARDAVDRLARRLAQGAAALVLAVDPELVVVGGGFGRAGELLLAPLRRHLADMCLDAPEVAASTFGDESVALGAVRLALDRVESDVLDL